MRKRLLQTPRCVNASFKRHVGISSGASLVRVAIYFHTLCMWEVRALCRLVVALLLVDAINTTRGSRWPLIHCPCYKVHLCFIMFKIIIKKHMKCKKMCDLYKTVRSVVSQAIWRPCFSIVQLYFSYFCRGSPSYENVNSYPRRDFFFGVLRGRNSAPFPMGFRWLFSQFEKKSQSQKKNFFIFFFLEFSFSHHTHTLTSYKMTIY